jgi:ketosteroid isomerase-like protein
VSATAQRTFEAYRDATELRDADAVLRLFADDAVLVEYDTEHPPSRPEERRGKGKIEEMLRDIYGRDMTHKVEGQVIGEDRFSFIERCEYPDGNRVIASGVCELREGQIQRETMLQAWDG